MRAAFILLRLIGYAWIGVYTLRLEPSPILWLWVVAAFAWTIWDHLKRPDDASSRLRLGMWIEVVVIAITTILLHQLACLFLLISPVARACVHLAMHDYFAVGSFSIAFVWLGALLHPTAVWVPWAESGGIAAVGSYSFVLGSMLRAREQLRKALSLSVFEQEQRARDEERLRMATQLHDVMGQYWTAVIRALDVVESTEGELQNSFIHKARQAASEGLQEMRHAVHSWNQGRQSALEWMSFLGESMHRLHHATGIVIECAYEDIDWHRLPAPESVAEAMARTAIEAATNAIRHGRATHIRVQVTVDDSFVTLQVTDNGTGLQTTIPDAVEGVGLRSMHQLATSVQGRLDMGNVDTGAFVRLAISYRVAMPRQVAEMG